MFDYDDLFDSGGSGDPCFITAGQVADVWQSLIETRQPWSAMPVDDRFGYFRTFVNEVLDVTAGFGTAERDRRILAAARRHGAFRRRQQASEYIVLLEFAALRGAMHDVLTRAGAPSRAVREFTRLLLPDLQSARGAALSEFADT